MALDSNALTTVAKLRRYMRTRFPTTDFLTVYHDGTGVSSATVEVTPTAVVLTTNVGTDTLTFASNTTVAAMVTAINALGNWVAVAVADGSQASEDLEVVASSNALLSTNTRTLDGVDTLALEDAINAASNEIEAFCSRTFAATDYRQAISGSGTEKIQLVQYPVNSITYVALGRLPVMKVEYASSSALWATVRVSSTAVVLTVDGTEASIALSTNTLTQLKTLIDAESGWSATIENSDFNSYLAADLLQTPGQYAKNDDVLLHVPDFESYPVMYDYNSEEGILTKVGLGVFEDPVLRIRPEHTPGVTPTLINTWPAGRHNVVVKYNAGYSTIPSDVERVANELASNMYRSGKRDTSLSSESVGGASYSAASSSVFGQSATEGPLTSSMQARLTKYMVVSRPDFVDV